MTVPRLRLRVSSAAESNIRAGHPWVYESSVREENRPGITGELAVIYDRKDRFLAVGLYDFDSVIRVRILHQGAARTIDDAWWEERLKAALDRRDALLDNATTGCRLINGESDGWPGLVLDKYADCCVVKLYSASWLPRISAVAQLIARACNPSALVLRLSRNIQVCAQEQFGLQDGSVIHGALERNPVIFTESEIRFEADVLRGQKTGFFLDQRENRQLVGEVSGGKTVLNAFSFSGGFSLYAARGGARSVTDLDISAHALESSRRNHELNSNNSNVRACAREWIQADVFEWLNQARERSFDMVILDPPSLAKREAERAGAIQAYARLALMGAARVRHGGVLAAFSCSAHVTEEEFFRACIQGVARTGQFDEVRRTAHARDHPANFVEAKYLKGIYFRRS